ncbi:hypothetical protein ABZP36_012199 [Zizania latifolia]
MARSGGRKKGPWTQAEDKLLVDHVRWHGRRPACSTAARAVGSGGPTTSAPTSGGPSASSSASMASSSDGDGSGNASLPTPLLYDARNTLALPPAVPSPSASASASHSLLINQNYPLLNKMQGLHLLHLANQKAQGAPRRSQPSTTTSPLPTRAHELPSNQFDTASRRRTNLTRRVGEWRQRAAGVAAAWRRPPTSAAQLRHAQGARAALYREPNSRPAGRATVTSPHSAHPERTRIIYGSKWDFVFENVKPSKRREASAVGEISDMFGIIPGSIPGGWFSTGGESSAPSPGPSSLPPTMNSASRCSSSYQGKIW